jgi:hypothetical protein
MSLIKNIFLNAALAAGLAAEPQQTVPQSKDAPSGVNAKTDLERARELYERVEKGLQTLRNGGKIEGFVSILWVDAIEAKEIVGGHLKSKNAWGKEPSNQEINKFFSSEIGKAVDLEKMAKEAVTFVAKDYAVNFLKSAKLASDMLDISPEAGASGAKSAVLYLKNMAKYANKAGLDITKDADLAEIVGENKVSTFRKFVETFSDFKNELEKLIKEMKSEPDPSKLVADAGVLPETVIPSAVMHKPFGMG